MQDGAVAACLKYCLRRYVGRHKKHKNTWDSCILAEIQTRIFPDTLIKNAIIKEEKNVC
jgi:SNF2 family DNA or RNA helicase